MLHGREQVIERGTTLLEARRTGRAGALLITGDSGQGKTALLDSAANLVDQSSPIPVHPDDHGHWVGLGLLALRAELTAERPMLCLFEDAQW
ncbi:MAG: ATP-binding protein [Nocardia sp.]|nr:ATP-binding protein [Nocardia sp.]